MQLLSRLVEWSLRNRVLVIVATLTLVLMGVRAASRLPVDAVPDVTTIQVQVITSAPALPPLEIERYVSVPVERAMQGLPGATEVRSLSRYGISIVTIVFEEGTDIWFARQLVGERMGEATRAVLADHGTPEIGPVSTGLGEIYQFALRNPDLDAMQLEELLDWYLSPRLRAVPGVVEINSLGGEDREYHVVLDPARMRSMGVSIADVARAVEASNANAGGGYVEQDRRHVVIATDGLVAGREDLERVVLGRTAAGAAITIADVGNVQFRPRLRRGAASMDGEGEVVVGMALMLVGENPRRVAKAVHDRLAELEATLPPGTTITPFYDRSALVDRTLRTALVNLGEGALLVVFVLFLLLGDLRAGLVVASVIPLAMCFAVVVMEAAGISANLMSLGAIDFGLVVDGAVIIVENVARRLGERGSDAPRNDVETVKSATLEVRRATVYGEIVIAIVYLPVLGLRGIEGKLFAPMVTTVLLVLAGAFILSLTWVPVLAGLILRPRARRSIPIMRTIARAYEPVLGACLAHPRRALAVGAAIVLAASVLATRLGAEFVPRLDEGDVLVEVRRSPGVALSESVAQDQRMQRALAAIPEIEHVVSKTGAPEVAADPMGLGQTDVYIALAPPESWRTGLDKPALGAEILEAVQTAVSEADAELSQPIEMRTNELVAGIRSDVGILVYGPSLSELARLGDAVAGALDGVPGVGHVRVERLEGLGSLRIAPDRTRLARHGLTVADVNLAAEAIAVGHGAGIVREGDRSFAIRIRVGEPTLDLDVLADLPLRSAQGGMVPLGEVATLRLEDAPAAIDREGLSRRVLIEFDVEGGDLVGTVAAAREALAQRVTWPVGYHVEWGGTFRHFEEARDRLLVAVPAALVSIVLVLWLAFRSLAPTLVILANVPFAAVGGVLALVVRGIPFSISAGIGFIALFGVAILDGLLVVTVAQRFERQGLPRAQAVHQAAVQRLRPVVTTALVAAIGLVPMALSTAPGAEVQRPLATVVIGGICTAALYTLLLLPALWRGRRAPG
jgi:cobalt-zinc-cadmium resistance protein CzcA